jgi:hypothetical protein
MHHTSLQLVAALAQVVATQAAQHKVTRHAVPRELTDSLAAAASTANAIKLPAAVATLFGQAAGAAAPAKVSRGPVAQHQDRFKGGDAADTVHLQYIRVSGPPAEFVLIHIESKAERRIPIEPGTHITYDNAVYGHRVDAHPNSTRVLLGPASLSPGGRLAAVGNVPGYAMDDDSIRTAVAAWTSDAAAAEATYGHISKWDTSGVTDMSWLFCVRQASMEGHSEWDDCTSTSSQTFNEDISAWDTTDVTSMLAMFAGASSFNQPLGDWSLDKIIDMRWMFRSASAFDQDLGWCVVPYNGQSPPDGIFRYAFDGTLCESTACGVVEDGCTGAPTTSAPTGFVTPPFNVGGNTTSTCITAPDGAQRTPDGSGRCAASWLYERDREPWVPGATACFGRANFGCQKCDGDAHPWCEAVDDDGNHTGWCYSEHQSNVHPTDLLICAQVLLLRRGHGRGK